jgi:hypothetical protein
MYQVDDQLSLNQFSVQLKSPGLQPRDIEQSVNLLLTNARTFLGPPSRDVRN